mgnify:CR=1 FL=1
MNILDVEIIHSNVQKKITGSSELRRVHHPKLHSAEFQSHSRLTRSGNGIHLNTRQKTTLCIKNMVSIRCKMVVKSVLERLGLHYSHLELGRVEITDNFPQEKHEEVKAALLQFGLELMDDESAILVERIKNVIIEMIHYEDEMPKAKFSVYLCEKLNNEFTYAYLSALFAEVKGVNIEHFVIVHKIERAKELMVYNEGLSLSEIAWKLHYSSVAHLSNQFKKITGLTPTHFKNMKNKRLTALEDL